MGPGRLERERPHLAPVNPSEELWYRGLIFSAFAETPSGMAEFLYIPGDIASLLPPPEPALAGLTGAGMSSHPISFNLRAIFYCTTSARCSASFRPARFILSTATTRFRGSALLYTS